MYKIEVSKLSGSSLDWAVAKAEGRRIESTRGGVYWPELCHYSPSTSWDKIGPLIYREGITISEENKDTGLWSAYIRQNLFLDDGSDCWQLGETPQVAAARCYVASKLGREVEIPDELIC